MRVVGVDVLEVALDAVDDVLVDVIPGELLDGLLELLDLNREYIEGVDLFGTVDRSAHACEL